MDTRHAVLRRTHRSCPDPACAMRVRIERERVETTEPHTLSGYRTFVPGKRRAYVEVRIPFWLVTLLYRCGAKVT
jgi:hypothetical protein